ncbi:membrane protein insertase YidC [Roseospira marina]|uniref:Membrane protein insertase YidC n=1 Tax=Roseospira marina TaxID=140057 RepID=A0A5M6IG70_9PROT|nr:membrane protein insertase YidC [Roseospira marina]KAA5606675.1 membrane protein insertase YidC [Roseospira marina]MBB4313915.1 YidC/Oxa1 family membrane protein insertase [Roseospira marina]MBB5087077.1 YidC/Oxa1 family membrane protein insertase [Roseospira marina]
MVEQRNLILAVVLSIAVLFGFEMVWRVIVPPPEPVETVAGEATTSPAEPGALPGEGSAGAPGAPAADSGGAVPSAPGAETASMPATAGAMSRDEAIAATEGGRVAIDTPRVHGSIRLRGARLDDLTLPTYREELDPNSPPIHLFSPAGSVDPYYAEFGWVAAATPAGVSQPVPGPETQWQASGDTLHVNEPITLTWDNGQGLRFVRTVAIDENYMFTMTQRVENTGGEPVTLYPYGLVSRTDRPKTTGIWILHEGPLGVFDGTLKEVNYKDLEEDEPTVEQTSTGGWIGITDKYWLAALAYDQQAEATTRFTRRMVEGRERFQVDYRLPGETVAPGSSVETTNRLFAGAKKVQLLDGYEEKYGITNFDLAIDFGWFYFMTKPFFYGLLWLEDVLGNFGLAILGFTVLIKLAFFPLANKSYKSMTKMKMLQPEMKKLQERFKDDRQRMSQELMMLYKREKASPVSGCLPILIQIPVFFSLYKVLFVSIEMRHAPFYGWIHDLSAPDPTNVFTLFGLIPWDTPAFLAIGIWPLIMGVTMFLQQKLNPAPPDPTQARIMMFLPIMFTFMLAHFPAGLVIYWTWNNLLSMAQQWFIMKRMGVSVSGEK